LNKVVALINQHKNKKARIHQLLLLLIICLIGIGQTTGVMIHDLKPGFSMQKNVVSG